jgi:phosphate starvation-inducible PhoH-like protein
MTSAAKLAGKKALSAAAMHTKSIAYTPRQHVFMHAVDANDVVVLHGAAGTGKTRCAVDAGARMLAAGEVRRLVITRPAVSAQEEHGFLPGGLDEKMRPWVAPIYDALGAHFGNAELASLSKHGMLEISPLAYMRGRTFAGAFVLCDEAQNCTASQLKMVLTRIGRDSCLVVSGDPEQDDLGLTGGRLNGLSDLLARVERFGAPPGLEVVSLGSDEVPRHEIIPRLLSLYRQDLDAAAAPQAA